MLRRQRSLIGLDLGSTRYRLVALQRSNAHLALAALIARDVPDGASEADRSLLLREMFDEASCRAGRCVIGLDPREASVHVLALPSMTQAERRRAASFEAARFIDYPRHEASIQVTRLADAERYLLGIARRSHIARLGRLVERGGAKVVAVDHALFALRRAFSQCDVILDIGSARTRVYAYAEGMPVARVIGAGAADVTAAIARSLAIDVAAAERRKRTVGACSAARTALEELAARIRAATIDIASFNAQPRFALTGNGSRTSCTGEVFAAVFGATPCSSSPVLADSRYPLDVVQATWPDWALAYGLACRHHAAERRHE